MTGNVFFNCGGFPWQHDSRAFPRWVRHTLSFQNLSIIGVSIIWGRETAECLWCIWVYIGCKQCLLCSTRIWGGGLYVFDIIFLWELLILFGTNIFTKYSKLILINHNAYACKITQEIPHALVASTKTQNVRTSNKNILTIHINALKHKVQYCTVK